MTASDHGASCHSPKRILEGGERSRKRQVGILCARVLCYVDSGRIIKDVGFGPGIEVISARSIASVGGWQDLGEWQGECGQRGTDIWQERVGI